MVRVVMTNISYSLYKRILDEKKRLVDLEKKKVKSRRKQITMIHASNNLVRKL
jgi:ABC-type phosphate/phosphonate transport system ATPase subunit